MSGYRFTAEFKENISFLESKLLSVIDKISLSNNINPNLTHDTNDSRFIKNNDNGYTMLFTGKKGLLVANEPFSASTVGQLEHSSGTVSIIHYQFSTDAIFISNNALEYKDNSFFKFIQSLPNGKDFFIYMNHFLSFSKRFFNNIEFYVKININDNIEITSINILFFQSIDNLQSPTQQYSVVLYDSDLWKAYNIDKIEDMFNLMELSFCFELFDDFSDIMGNPEGNDMLQNFSAHKESYIALAEINAV